MSENERPRSILRDLSEAVRQYNDAIVQNSPVAERDRLRGHVFTQISYLVEAAFSAAHVGAQGVLAKVHSDAYVKQAVSLLRRIGANDLNIRERDEIYRERDELNGDVASRINDSITTLIRQLEQFDGQISQAKDDKPDRRIQTIDDLVEGKVRRGVRTLEGHLLHAVGLATALNSMVETTVESEGSSHIPGAMDPDPTPLLSIRPKRFATHRGKAAFLARITRQFCEILRSELETIEQAIRNAKVHGSYDAIALQAAMDGFVRILQAAHRSCALLDELTLAPVSVWSVLFGARVRKELSKAPGDESTAGAPANESPANEMPIEAPAGEARSSE